jgi:hypothetical protein
MKRATGGKPPLRGGSLRPLTESRGGGRGASAWGGRGSARHHAVYGRGGAHCEGAGARCRGVWERGGGDAGRHHYACRALEEEEVGFLHLEVGNRSSRCPVLERRESNPSVLRLQGGTDCPPSRARQGA